jgi:glycosyltransferase involved in cell wall biosynthesis
MADKVSVIIAAYNEEKNIEKCINSILQQDYKNIEIIVVNDGSTDGTAELLTKYNNYTNVHVTNINNSGVSNARNIGIKMATGKWIVFADADDYYYNESVSNLMNTAKSTGCDVVQGGLTRNRDTDKSRVKVGNVFELKSNIVAKVLLDYDAELSDEYTMYDTHMRLSTHGPYGKLIKKDILDYHNISFDIDMGLGEDLLFYFKILNAVERIAIYEDDVYVVEDNPQSSTRKFNNKMPGFAVTFTNRIIEYMNENNIYEKYKSNLCFQIYMHIIVAINCYYLHEDNDRSDYSKAKELKAFINNDAFFNALIQMNNRNGSKYNKLMLGSLIKKQTYLYIKLGKFRKWVKEGLKNEKIIQS